MAASLTTEEVRDWLNRLVVSNQTRKNFRRVLATFFGFALDNYVRGNPVTAIKGPAGISATFMSVQIPFPIRPRSVTSGSLLTGSTRVLSPSA